MPSPDLPILYSFRRCPYAIRARMALYYSGVVCELREILLKDKPAQMLAQSPKGTVPVLQLQNQVVDQSIEVMAWALAQNDPDNWQLAEFDDDLVQSNDGEFKHYLDRYKYHDRYPEYSQLEYFEKACDFIRELEMAMQLDQVGRPWLNSSAQISSKLEPSRLSALDIAIFPFVRQFALVDKARFDALEFEQVQRWLDYHLSSELFDNVMQKYPVWTSNQAIVYFGQDSTHETGLRRKGEAA